MTNENLMTSPTLDDFDQLKEEIASNAGLILKDIPEIPENKINASAPFSFLEDISENNQQAHLVKLLNKFKEKIISLNKRILVEQERHQSILKEKAILIKEIKRLRGESDKIKSLGGKIEELEKKSRTNQETYEALLKEKDKLVKAFEETRKELFYSKGESEEAVKKYSELYSSHTILQVEKENLQKDLNIIKSDFKSKLNEKTKIIERTFDKKVEYLRKQKSRVEQFSTEVMDEPDAPAWMITYGDMVTLLLTFFILYYSIAAQNLMKFKDVIFGETKNNIGLIELLDTMDIKTSLNEWTGFQKNSLLNDMKKISSDHISLDSGQNNSRIVVRIPGRTLFEPGSAELAKAGWPSLTEIAGIFKNYPGYKINIQGHTDDLPMANEKFPTNWELSAVRATAVLRFLNDKGINPMNMTATGYADTFPLGPNTTAEERSKNRRVEFVLEKIK